MCKYMVSPQNVYRLCIIIISNWLNLKKKERKETTIELSAIKVLIHFGGHPLHMGTLKIIFSPCNSHVKDVAKCATISEPL